MVPPVDGSQAALVEARDHCSGPGRFEPVCRAPRNKRDTRREVAEERVDCVLETQAPAREPASQGLSIRYERVGN